MSADPTLDAAYKLGMLALERQFEDCRKHGLREIPATTFTAQVGQRQVRISLPAVPVPEKPAEKPWGTYTQGQE